MTARAYDEVGNPIAAAALPPWNAYEIGAPQGLSRLGRCRYTDVAVGIQAADHLHRLDGVFTLCDTPVLNRLALLYVARPRYGAPAVR